MPPCKPMCTLWQIYIKKSYDSAWSCFTSFCDPFFVAILPTNISVICAFIIHCFESWKMQPSSIKGLDAGIQFHLRCLDPPTTTQQLENPSVHLLLNGLKREKPQGNDIVQPFTLPLLQTGHMFMDWVLWSLYRVVTRNNPSHSFFRFIRGGKFTIGKQSLDHSYDRIITTHHSLYT